MLLFVVLIIALGWAAFAVTWGRDRLNSRPSFGIPPSPYDQRSSGPFAAPQTPEMARIRRQQVFAGLVGAALLTVLLAQLWTVMWGLHILVDIALVAFAVAVYARSAKLSSAPRSFNEPVVADRAAPIARGRTNGPASVLSSSPTTALRPAADDSLIELPERRLPSMSATGRFAPVLEDERTAVRPGPAR